MTFDALIFESPKPFPVCKPADKIPSTVRLVSVPTDVILTCAGFITTPAVATVPVTFAARTLPIPDPSEVPKSPFTYKVVRVPTLVIFG